MPNSCTPLRVHTAQPMRPGRVGAKAVSTRPAISRAGAKPRCSQPRMRGLRGCFPSSVATATSSSGLSATAIITNLRFRNLRLRRLPPEVPESNSRSRPVRSASRASRNHPTHARGLVAGPASRLPDGFDTGHSFVATRLNQLQEVPHHRRHPLNPFPLVHESQKKNGSTSCGDVGPSNLCDSCMGRRAERGVVSTQSFASLTCWLNRRPGIRRGPAEPVSEGGSR